MTTQTAYQYDHAGLYVGTTTADPSPMEDGVYLYPARTTAVAPPETIPAGQWPRWNGVTWQLITKPTMPKAPSAAQKLADFINENPDVAELIK